MERLCLSELRVGRQGKSAARHRMSTFTFALGKVSDNSRVLSLSNEAPPSLACQLHHGSLFPSQLSTPKYKTYNAL